METNQPPNPLKRLRYFSGRMLSADDLETEQQYFREKLKRHNRFLHGSGVVVGLGVGIEDNQVVVSSGLALDCTGEEIWVPAAVQTAPPDENHIAFLMIRYVEEQTGGAPVPGQGGTAQEAVQPLYTSESYSFSYVYDDPYMGHGEDPLIWVPCGKSHAIPLAKLFKRRDTWEVDPWFEPPSIA